MDSRDLSTHLAIRSDSSIRLLDIVSLRFTSLDLHISDGIDLVHFFRVFALPLQYADISLSTRLVRIGKRLMDSFIVFSRVELFFHFLPIFSLTRDRYASTISRLDSEILGNRNLVMISRMVSSSVSLPIIVAIPYRPFPI